MRQKEKRSCAFLHAGFPHRGYYIPASAFSFSSLTAGGRETSAVPFRFSSGGASAPLKQLRLFLFFAPEAGFSGVIQ
jgi:hypothetical protein